MVSLRIKESGILKIVLRDNLIKHNQCCGVDYVFEKKPTSMSKMHYHPFYEMYFLVSGRRKYFLSNKIIILNPGDVLVVNPNEIHKAVSSLDNQYERYVLNISAKFIDKLLKQNPILKDIFDTSIIALSPVEFKEILEIIKIIQIENTKEEKFSDVIVKNYIERIIIILNKVKASSHFEQLTEKTDIRLQDALDYISENFKKKISIQECADIIHMSKSNFTKIFNSSMGVNFKTYINSLRIEESCRLLKNTDDTIVDIAFNTGFESPSYFSEVFRERIGISPREYRVKTSVENKTTTL